jgi:DEAD/DEAH box helicase domain-containing protein
LYRRDAETFADEIKQLEDELAATAKPVTWKRLVEQFAHQTELRHFAGDVWRERSRGRQLAEDAAQLAEMFLYRELFRRPKVQNNPETMGLLRLSFPSLEERARAFGVPAALREAGVEAEGWIGLALAAVDFVFRDSLSVDIPQTIVRWIAPRGGKLGSVCAPGLPPEDRPEGARAWPSRKPPPGKPSRLLRLVSALIGGVWDSRVDQDRAGDVLVCLWRLITETAARDVGRGAYRLDFAKAAVVRRSVLALPGDSTHFWLRAGWPVSSRPGAMMTPVSLPALPFANAGGLDWSQRDQIREWCAASLVVAALRAQGL